MLLIQIALSCDLLQACSSSTQEAPSLATGYGDPQGPPPQAPPPQAPPPQYSGEPRAPPPPQGGPYGGYQSTPGGYQGAQNTNTTVVVQNAAAAPNPVSLVMGGCLVGCVVKYMEPLHCT